MKIKYLFLLLVISGCLGVSNRTPEVNECVIGPKMDVLKLLRTKDEDKYMFVEYPYDQNSPIEIMEDVSALKKVECPE